MREKKKDLLIRIWLGVSIVSSTFLVLYILGYIFKNGFEAISLDFIFNSPKGIPIGAEGGIFPAIVGSIILTIFASLFASILGISTAIYNTFYCKNEKRKSFICMIVQCISGIPSIVLGLFGYTLLVLYLDFGRSVLSAGITLGIMIFPFIEVRIEKILQETDSNIISSSYALGVSKEYTILKLVLPLCKSEIVSCVLLAGGLAIGATAPIILTGAVISAPVPNSIFSPVMALPFHLYILVNESLSLKNAYGTSLIMIILLLLINFLSIFIVSRRSSK
ncbi:phosphate ABC transporter permease protein PstA [Gottschalkia purinilytica]|uniref:Phosphate ABC transporter permease protein PstA n=1 Tax=Gottschalkia purinilytica TaxID=1503 RepID=A0A0L0W7W3_GOTPU|nr:ABC transporter permease subunit [Gottschalkia purinilytica]KNF07522.1 phosphate ABC transporter permease protein PstA [Gottschalkia purinilytica]